MSYNVMLLKRKISYKRRLADFLSRGWWIWGALAVYSLALVFIEAGTSQAILKMYCTDIKGPVRFYAVNTSLSTFMLWATALVFGLNFHITRPVGLAWDRQSLFYASQVAMFAYLGFDERFQFHEILSGWIGLPNDVYLVMTMGVIELGMLFGIGRVHHATPSARNYLLGAALCFGVMVIIDGFFPSRMFLRLSFEEIFKIWADFLLLCFALELFSGHVRALKSSAQTLDETG